MNKKSKKIERPLKEARDWKRRVSKKTKKMSPKKVLKFFATAPNQLKRH